MINGHDAHETHGMLQVQEQEQVQEQVQVQVQVEELGTQASDTWVVLSR